MKFKNLLNALTAFTLFCISVNAWAALKHYENTNTNGFIFGSYDFDTEQNIFSNINLKVNFSAVGGPSAINIQGHDIVYGEDTISIGKDIITDGSSDASYYTYYSGFFLFKSFPYFFNVTRIQRFELLYSGGFGPIDFMTPPYNDEDFFVTFTERADNTSAVPEPELISLLIFGMILVGSKISRKKS